jgi:hypothetical protein
MNILLYSPDSGVTRNVMPQLGMFLLKNFRPPKHEAFLIDGNEFSHFEGIYFWQESRRAMFFCSYANCSRCCPL